MNTLSSYAQAQTLIDRAVALLQADQLSQAQSAWQEAERIAHSTGLRSWEKTDILCQLTKVLAKARQWLDAERVVTSMQDGHLQAQALRSLAKELARSHQWQEAERLAHSKHGYAWEETRILCQLAKALAKAQQWPEAERVVTSMQDGHLQAQALRSLAKELARSHQWQEAERITFAITGAAYQAVALRCLARDFAKSHQWQEAERITFAITGAAYQAVALRCLARDFAKSHQWEEAERVASSIADAANQAIAYYDIATSLLQIRQKPQAQNMRQKAALIVASLNDNSPSLSWLILRDLVAALTQARHWQEAERIASLTLHGQVQLDIMNNLVTTLEKAKRHSQAQGLRQKADQLNKIRQQQMDMSRARTYSHQANFLKGLKRFDEALAAFEQAILLDPSDAHTYL